MADTLIDWLQSRLSIEEHAEQHLQADGSYLTVIVSHDLSENEDTVIVSSEGASLAEALADLKQGGTR